MWTYTDFVYVPHFHEMISPEQQNTHNFDTDFAATTESIKWQ